jgi:hypothetical protein
MLTDDQGSMNTGARIVLLGALAPCAQALLDVRERALDVLRLARRGLLRALRPPRPARLEPQLELGVPHLPAVLGRARLLVELELVELVDLVAHLRVLHRAHLVLVQPRLAVLSDARGRAVVRLGDLALPAQVERALLGLRARALVGARAVDGERRLDRRRALLGRRLQGERRVLRAPRHPRDRLLRALGVLLGEARAQPVHLALVGGEAGLAVRVREPLALRRRGARLIRRAERLRAARAGGDWGSRRA